MYTEFEQSKNKIFAANYKHILLFLYLETTYVHWEPVYIVYLNIQQNVPYSQLYWLVTCCQ